MHTTYAGFMSANRTSYECVSQEQPMYMVKITKTVLGENVEFEVQDADEEAQFDVHDEVLTGREILLQLRALNYTVSCKSQRK